MLEIIDEVVAKVEIEKVTIFVFKLEDGQPFLI